MTEAIDANLRKTYLAGKLAVLARHGGAVHAGQMCGCAEQRARITLDYSVQGVKVFQAGFLFTHSCSRYVLKKVSSHLESGCGVTPDHGSKVAVPWNALNPEEVSTSANFMQNYADKHGLPQPAAPRGHNGAAPIYLPCVTTKNMIHAFYLQEGGSMSKSSFMRVRLKMCANIVIMKPREDVSATCSNLQSKISRALTEDERISTTEALRQHANKAINSRDFYRSCIARAKIAEDEDTEVQSFCHLTFDFAQQASIPHHGRQVGALYFHLPRRIQIFGVASEGVPEQYKYLVDEHQAIGKDGSKSHGPNAVVSMLHHHLETHTKASNSVGLHADNCCRQVLVPTDAPILSRRGSRHYLYSPGDLCCSPRSHRSSPRNQCACPGRSCGWFVSNGCWSISSQHCMKLLLNFVRFLKVNFHIFFSTTVCSYTQNWHL